MSKPQSKNDLNYEHFDSLFSSIKKYATENENINCDEKETIQKQKIYSKTNDLFVALDKIHRRKSLENWLTFWGVVLLLIGLLVLFWPNIEIKIVFYHAL